MNIVVCVKHIPDPNLPAEMDDDRLKREGVQGVLDPGDEFGVEAGLQLKEAHGGEVTLVSMGPAAAMEAIREASRWAPTRASSSRDDALQGADALVTARVLAAAIKKQRVRPRDRRRRVDRRLHRHDARRRSPSSSASRRSRS